MNNELNLKKNVSRNGYVLGIASVAILIFSIVGIRSAFASIDTQLDYGDRSAEVTKLQTYLSADASIYPSKLVTGYFGQLTKAAIERFQTREGIVSSGTPLTTGYGRVGPITRAAINIKLAGSYIPPSGDISAPTFISVNVTTDNNGATVTWVASEASYGKVYYSTSPIMISNVYEQTGVFSGEPVVSGTLAQYDGLARSTHTVNINNLSSNTRYYYLVVIFDATKNISYTLPASFYIN